tara:strand:+ start:571 stop:768 length:198 start_codon:yes stop_codon:yes gene_type:complete
MPKPKRFVVLADVEVSWEYEIYADNQEEALEMWNTGNHEYHVINEIAGDVKFVRIEKENTNDTNT